MTVRKLLSEGAGAIKTRWPDTPQLDASVILQNILDIPREKLLSSYETEVDEENTSKFREAVEKRISGYPVAYITGKKEFFAIDFFVEEGILVPRSDTEILVGTVIDMAVSSGRGNISILDLCTGSGCIAISLKQNLPGACIEASDISEISERIFKKNCFNLLEKEIKFIKSNLFKNIKREYDIIVSNPPYLTDEHVDSMVSLNWPEPESALRGGGDEGLDFIREIISESKNHLSDGGIIALEADPSQMVRITDLLKINSFTGTVIKRDLAGRERVIAGIFRKYENDR